MFFVKERASREAATTCREAARRESKTSCCLTFLSCRWQGQDLTLWCWLVDIFRNMQINLIGSFDCNYWGDAEDISHLISFGKFCFPLPGKKIVCKISVNYKGWQVTHLHWCKTFENLLHIASERRTLSGILLFKNWMIIQLGSNAWWCSGESTPLPPMWPAGFNSQVWCHMWVEFVVGSLPCSKRFFSR